MRSLLLLFLSALAVILSFPRSSIYPLAFIALAPALYVCEGSRARARRAFQAGWLVGLLAHLGTLWWIARLYPTEITYPWLRLPALLLLACFEGVFYGLAFWGWNAASRGRRWWLWPGVWVTAEYARSLGSMAFPWTVLGNALAAQPLLLQPAVLGGVWLLDLGLASVNLLLYKSVERPRYLWAAVLVLGCWIGGGMASMGVERGSLQVGIVQPNALPDFKWHQGGQRRVLRDLEELSAAAVDSMGAGGTRLLVWPETAVPLVMRPGGGAEFWLTRLVNDLQVPVITGTLGTRTVRGQELPTNAAVVAVPGTGITARYDKLHLVPFSEKMPLSDRLPAINELNFGQGDYAAGTDPVILEAHGVKAAVLICFEAILPALVRRHAAEGAEVFVNITNDSWFGASGAPEQHAAIAVIRAVEHRRWLVRAANTGLSLVADPWGRVVRHGGLFRPEVLIADIQPRRGRTPYARVGDWAAWLGIFATLWVGAHARARR
ncbi:MAG: apolipoprotein N-acyltransferase [Candidatus Eisenbacteria bacterium]|nr:apolipoprotein N-acyltransferase [Candidatus Eisenbacteria bacterium]